MKTAASWASLVTLPDVIVGPGQYLTRCGERVTVHAVSTRHDFDCRGRYSTGQYEGWHKSGRLMFGQQTPNDIVTRDLVYAAALAALALLTDPEATPAQADVVTAQLREALSVGGAA